MSDDSDGDDDDNDDEATHSWFYPNQHAKTNLCWCHLDLAKTVIPPS